jgi:hypothetical protein
MVSVTPLLAFYPRGKDPRYPLDRRLYVSGTYVLKEQLQSDGANNAKQVIVPYKYLNADLPTE